MTDELAALRARAVEKGLRIDDEAPAPTQEELEAYVREVEKAYLTEEEQELALQAQADLAKGEREARDLAKRTIRAQKRAWKGIHNRTHFIIWAKQALRREELRQQAAIDKGIAERDAE